MYDLLLQQGVKRLKGVLDIFREQSYKLRGIPSATVFFEKVILKIFRKFLEKRLWQSSCSAHLQVFRLVNMLNTIFCLISTGSQISVAL